MIGGYRVHGAPLEEWHKGADRPHGDFQFGGSTVLLLFRPGRVAFDGALLRNSMHRGLETRVKARSRIGVALQPAASERRGNF